MVKLGIVVFANDSGLGAQTRRLTYMLKPDRILAIDSSGFSKNKTQHFDWYDGFDGYKVDGFPSNQEYKKFMQGLTHILVCENPLNTRMLSYAKHMGIKVYIQSNYEFCDHLDKQLDMPEKFLMPSYWHVDTMKQLFGDDKVQYLPPPINPQEFSDARNENMSQDNERRKFLHIVGTVAASDRNGTLSILEALKYCTTDFEIVIRSQHNLPDEYMTDDQRVTYRVGNVLDAQEMYAGYDAIILPRRYAGLSLITNEGLMSALPVIMTDISPNNRLLPNEWLVWSKKIDEFFTRTMIDVYAADPKKLAEKIDWFASHEDIDALKAEAFELGYNNFSDSILRPQYQSLFNQD